MKLLDKFKPFIKHLWCDVSDTGRVISADMLQRLMQGIAAREQGHNGVIRICVEAALPASYLWRLNAHTSMSALVRQRARMLFGKLQVWDTEHNNGVLIYILLAESAIEIVADRGIDPYVGADNWQIVLNRLRLAFQEERYEDGLSEALEEISARLQAYFTQKSEEGAERAAAVKIHELPDARVLQ